LLQVSNKQRRDFRGNKISMIFQEPMTSLNPVYTCGYQLTEAIRLHDPVSEAEACRRAASLLQEVRLLPSDRVLRDQAQQDAGEQILSDADLAEAVRRRQMAMLDRYPHELSGGQLQRIMIAMAISCNPSPGCDGPGCHVGSAAGSARPTRHGHDVYYPRSGPGGRNR
jgi:peptide/nickel transport system ATP-binding protein